jgi:hypothetical protein
MLCRGPLFRLGGEIVEVCIFALRDLEIVFSAALNRDVAL